MASEQVGVGAEPLWIAEGSELRLPNADLPLEITHPAGRGANGSLDPCRPLELDLKLRVAFGHPRADRKR